MHFFEKMSQKASKRVLAVPKARSRREHSKYSGFIEIGLICVELRHSYGYFTAALEFWPQCRISRFSLLRSLIRKLFFYDKIIVT